MGGGEGCGRRGGACRNVIVCGSFPLSSTVAPSTGSRHGLMTLLVSCEEGRGVGGGVGVVGGGEGCGRRWVWWGELHVGMY